MPDFDSAFNDVFADYLTDNPSVNMGGDDASFMAPPTKGYFGDQLNRSANSTNVDEGGGAVADPMAKYWNSFLDKGLRYAGQSTTIGGMPGASDEGANLTPNQVFERGAGESGNFVKAPSDYGRNLGYFWGSSDGSALKPEGAGATWTPTNNYGAGDLAKDIVVNGQMPGLYALAAAGGANPFATAATFGANASGDSNLKLLAGAGKLFGGGGGADIPYDVGENLMPNPDIFGEDVSFDSGENLVNNPDIFGGGSAAGGVPDFLSGASTLAGQTIDPNTLQPTGGAPMSLPATTGAPVAFSPPPEMGGGSGLPIGGDASGIVDPNDPDKLLKTGQAASAGAGTPTAAQPSFIQKAVDSVTKNPLQAAALAANAVKQYQTNKNGQSAQDQLKTLSAPARAASEQLINQGMAGTVPAPIMQQFQTTFNNTKAAIESRYANMGRDPNNDSSAQAEIKQAKDQMDAQVANYASTLLNQGLSAAGVANGPATAAINAGVAQDKELGNAMSQSLQQMAMLQAMQSGKQANP